MIWRPVIFDIVLAAICLYAARRGGLPERMTAVAMAVAAIATALIPTDHQTSFSSVEWTELGIDAGLLLALAALACASDRYWPMWVTALQLDAIAIHAVRAMDTTLIPAVYAAGVGWAAYPMLALLAIGTYRHQQRSLICRDADWSPLRW